jgi:hypothetical protein
VGGVGLLLLLTVILNIKCSVVNHFTFGEGPGTVVGKKYGQLNTEMLKSLNVKS